MARVVLITGGMSGIGLAAGQAFQRAGDRVFLVDKQETPAGQEVARQSGGGVFNAGGPGLASGRAGGPRGPPG